MLLQTYSHIMNIIGVFLYDKTFTSVLILGKVTKCYLSHVIGIIRLSSLCSDDHYELCK